MYFKLYYWNLPVRVNLCKSPTFVYKFRVLIMQLFDVLIVKFGKPWAHI